MCAAGDSSSWVELDLAKHLGDLGPELGTFGFEHLHRVVVTHVDVDLNWKLANDTGFEVYHVSYLHRDSVGPLNIGNTPTYQLFGYNHRMSIVSTSARELVGQPEHEWEPFEHMQFIYNVLPGGRHRGDGRRSPSRVMGRPGRCATISPSGGCRRQIAICLASTTSSPRM